MSELKPCPYCDGNKATVDINPYSAWGVFCPQCGANTKPSMQKKVSIKRWNTRVHDEKSCYECEWYGRAEKKCLRLNVPVSNDFYCKDFRSGE